MQHFFKEQLQIFLTAVMFYTRIPCPKWITHEAYYLNKATIYFPIIGWIVGGYSAFVFILTSSLVGVGVGLALSMVGSIFLTGAFHEDGLADVCDGFGGGWTKPKILEIMKDSRIGTYGVIGLMSVLILKYLLLTENLRLLLSGTSRRIDFWTTLTNPLLWALFVVPHTLSRLTALTFIFTHTYVRENEDSKAKPVANLLSLNELLLAFAFGLLPLIGLVFWTKQFNFLLLLLPLVLLKMYLGWYFQKWIGGYTGDCLGATQQISEVVLYMAWLVLCTQ
ncbi:MAG: adenosylcobinamide-GDP ribazoletransferase [Microscillaceae bacterium]|nr:adenosylcobinamide-GDP ribazoletransferase [Microscillaceae bacterium]MDW8460156.1 adenosylcobinamide-GDP ribazoletransferase [Cytophagales bacterium]